MIEILENIGLKPVQGSQPNDSLRLTSSNWIPINSGFQNKIKMPHPTNWGQFIESELQADIDLLLTGANLGLSGGGDVASVNLKVVLIQDREGAQPAFGITRTGGRRKISSTITFTDQASATADTHVLVNRAIDSGTWPMVEIGYVLADFTDSGSLWAIDTDDIYIDKAFETSSGGGGGASELDDLTDVVIDGTQADNEILGFNFGTGKWINQTAMELGLALATHTHSAGDIVSGTFANARISSSSVTQHEAAINHDNLVGFVSNEHLPAIDEDDMVSDSATSIPTQQSVKAYVDSQDHFASPLTTKGDIHAYGTGDTRLPVGSDGQILKANSNETLGLEWVDALQNTQRVTGAYTAASIALGTTNDGSFGDADATNAKIEVQVDEPGAYLIEFIVPWFTKTTSTSTVSETRFRLTDGTNNSDPTFAGIALAGVANPCDKKDTVLVSGIFDFTTPGTKTIKLQKRNTQSSNVSERYISASSETVLSMRAIRLTSFNQGAQEVSQVYEGGAFDIGNTNDGGYVDVDATNAKVDVDVNGPGKYLVLCKFSLRLTPTTGNIQSLTKFRFYDGATAAGVTSKEWFSDNDGATTTTQHVVTLYAIYDFATSGTKTIKLQKRNDTSTNVSIRSILAGTTEQFQLTVIRLSSTQTDLSNISGFGYSTPKTREWSMHGASGQPTDNTSLFSSSDRYGPVTGSDVRYPLTLPNGSTITAYYGYCYDNNNPGTVTIKLWRGNLSTGALTQIGSSQISSTSGTPGNITLSQTGLSEVVDNTTYAYFLQFLPSSINNANLSIRNVRVTYTVDGSDSLG